MVVRKTQFLKKKKCKVHKLQQFGSTTSVLCKILIWKLRSSKLRSNLYKVLSNHKSLSADLHRKLHSSRLPKSELWINSLFNIEAVWQLDEKDEKPNISTQLNTIYYQLCFYCTKPSVNVYFHFMIVAWRSFFSNSSVINDYNQEISLLALILLSCT